MAGPERRGGELTMQNGGQTDAYPGDASVSRTPGRSAEKRFLGDSSYAGSTPEQWPVHTLLGSPNPLVTPLASAGRSSRCMGTFVIPTPANSTQHE
jgi:hypothetical protein